MRFWKYTTCIHSYPKLCLSNLDFAETQIVGLSLLSEEYVCSQPMKDIQALLKNELLTDDNQALDKFKDIKRMLKKDSGKIKKFVYSRLILECY